MSRYTYTFIPMALAALALTALGSCLDVQATDCGGVFCRPGHECATSESGDAVCVLPRVCGNRIVEDEEVCDDGNGDDGDGCSADCRSVEICGNGVTDAIRGEVCDDGNQTPGDGCSADCTSTESCGNGTMDPGEVCDDGNTVSGDGCHAACISTEQCGNGFIDVGEACDCGDGSVAAPAGCADRPNSAAGGLCRADCRLHCGDGELAADELCDGPLFSAGFSCVELGRDFGHVRCLDQCSNVDLSDCQRYFEWQVVATPTTETLHSVWGSGPDDIYACGDNSTVLHHDGSAWRQLSDSELGLSESVHLRGVSGTAADDVYIVGDAGTVLRRDGSAWTREPLRFPDGGGLDTVTWPINAVTAVARDEVYAITARGDLFHRVGKEEVWNQQAIISGIFVTRNLHAIVAVSSDADGSHRATAVGDQGYWLFNRNDTWFRRVTSWTPLIPLHGVWSPGGFATPIAVGDNGTVREWGGDPPVFTPTSENLRGIWGFADDKIFAVGDNGTLIDFDSSSWGLRYRVDTDASLYAVWGTSPNNMYAVGDGGTVLHYAGQGREQTTVPEPASSTGTEAVAITGNARGVYVAMFSEIDITGDPENPWNIATIALASGGNTTEDYFSPPGESGPPRPEQIADIWALPSGGQVYAVTNGVLDSRGINHVIRYNGTSWSDLREISGNELNGVWADSSDILVVIESSRAHHYDGTEWTSLDANASGLRDVWGRAGDDVYAVGQNATITHFDGSDWVAEMTLPETVDETVTLRAIWGSDPGTGPGAEPGQIFVVGDRATLLHHDGEDWIHMEVPTTADLRSVSGRGPDDVYVAGARGALIHWNGETWARVRTDVLGELIAVWADPDSDAVFVIDVFRELHRFVLPSR